MLEISKLEIHLFGSNIALFSWASVKLQINWVLHKRPNDILMASCMTNCKDSRPEIQFRKCGWDPEISRLVLRLVPPCALSWEAGAEVLGHPGCLVI